MNYRKKSSHSCFYSSCFTSSCFFCYCICSGYDYSWATGYSSWTTGKSFGFHAFEYKCSH